LFDIQKTFDNPLVSADKGSGLGLLICKDFIESNQGKIWVKSEIGKGCKFYFTLKSAS
jgi:signal transduction histidine kinase